MSSSEIISRILGERTAGPAVEPAREWVFDDRRIVIDGHDVSVYMKDRVQAFVSLRPTELAKKLDSGKYRKLTDELGNRVCYENAIPFDENGKPFRWGLIIGKDDLIENIACFSTEDEAKTIGAKTWSMIPAEKRDRRYCLVGSIEPSFMITKAISPVWWPDLL